MSVSKLKSYLKKHGAAKTAVALGYRDTGAIKNWVHRNSIPEQKKDDVKKLTSKNVQVLEKGEMIKPAEA